MQTRDGRPVRTGPEVMPGPADTYIAYGRGWANVSNTPFREYKHWVHEGGISTPLIAHWPRGHRRRRAERAGPHAGPPDRPHGHLRGRGRAPLPGGVQAARRSSRWKASACGRRSPGRPLERPQPIFWEHEGNRAIRDGQWKLVAKGPRGRGSSTTWTPTARRCTTWPPSSPPVVQELAAQWEAWAAARRVDPLDLETALRGDGVGVKSTLVGGAASTSRALTRIAPPSVQGTMRPCSPWPQRRRPAGLRCDRWCRRRILQHVGISGRSACGRLASAKGLGAAWCQPAMRRQEPSVGAPGPSGQPDRGGSMPPAVNSAMYMVPVVHRSPRHDAPARLPTR